MGIEIGIRIGSGIGDWGWTGGCAVLCCAGGWIYIHLCAMLCSLVYITLSMICINTYLHNPGRGRGDCCVIYVSMYICKMYYTGLLGRAPRVGRERGGGRGGG